MMPIWGSLLTTEQLNALVSYTLEAARGTPLEVGQELFVDYCGACHGDFGEGGLNPARPDDIIAPISSAEYLQTRDDFTLRAIISQGQPNFGMSPFGSANGGPLDDDQIDVIVAYMRSWESNPPVELPPEIASTPISRAGDEIYKEVCAQCHGQEGEGLIGPSLRDPSFQNQYTDKELTDGINLGHDATAMIAWGEILSAEQIQQLVVFIRQLRQPPPETQTTPQAETDTTPEPEPSAEGPSFANDVLPIFEAKCTMCHGNLGGWDGTTYEATINTGNNAPVVIPGDAEGSLLGQKVLGTHEEGAIMPPAGRMPDAEIQVILNWINAGALDN
jgi:cytochrome c oxidase cbb3-type subunit 3